MRRVSVAGCLVAVVGVVALSTSAAQASKVPWRSGHRVVVKDAGISFAIPAGFEEHSYTREQAIQNFQREHPEFADATDATTGLFSVLFAAKWHDAGSEFANVEINVRSLKPLRAVPSVTMLEASLEAQEIAENVIVAETTVGRRPTVIVSLTEPYTLSNGTTITRYVENYFFNGPDFGVEIQFARTEDRDPAYKTMAGWLLRSVKHIR